MDSGRSRKAAGKCDNWHSRKLIGKEFAARTTGGDDGAAARLGAHHLKFEDEELGIERSNDILVAEAA